MNERLPPRERAAASLAVIEKLASAAAQSAAAPAAPPAPPRSKLAPRKTVSPAEHLGVD